MSPICEFRSWSAMESKIFAFGPFELNSTQQELRRRGLRLRLPASRIRLLLLFVSHPGDLITREEIAACLWRDAQNVDTMTGINTAVNQLRAQLGDDPASPKYIETAIGVGYRFIAAVSEIDPPSSSIVITQPLRPVVGHDEGLPPLTAEPISPAQSPARRGRIAIAAAAALVLGASTIYFVLRPATPHRTTAQTDMELIRITDSGDVKFADISPDGNYVTYVRETAGHQSLWLKQLATGRLLQLAAMGGYECPGLVFSPDGSYVYFVRMKPLAASGELYRVPFLGGSPTLVLAGISGAPALSPDGRKVAFVRSTLVTHGEDSIVTASIDGSGERTLISYSAPGIHFNRVTWTPDGTTLVYPVQSTLMAISADGGKALPVTGAKWTEIDDVWKLPPGRDLVVVGSASASILAQILQVSLAGGGIHALTHDLSNYTSVRVTADGKALLAVQQLVLSSVQVLAPGGESGNRSLSAENQNQDGVSGLAWTPDGKIVYTSQSERRSGLIEIDSDGSNPRRFADGDASSTLFSDPVVSPSGDFIAVARWSLGDGANIWRMNRSGGDSQRLTNGRQDFPPSITPDGQWIVYASVQGDKSILMKVASQGGTPIKLTDYDADSPSVSPDGRWIACAFTPHQDQPASLAIVPIAGGQPVKVFRLPETATPQSLAWTPDGRAVSFIENMNGASNIWQQPAAGGAATALTHFAAAKIFTFRWSRDGKLALSRGSESMDAVLIKDFREPGR